MRTQDGAVGGVLLATVTPLGQCATNADGSGQVDWQVGS